MNEIESKSRLKNLFYEWTEENQNEFLDFCTGVKGIKIMYDFMIKMCIRDRFKGLNEYAVFIDNLTRIFAVILVLKIYGRNETSSMKTPWIILILTFPILGVALYFMIGMNGGTRKMRMRYKRIDEKLLPLLPENKEVLERLNVSDPKAGNVSNYIERNACYPVYQNTDVTYFDEAVKGLEAQLTDLAKAEQFIFMEYHAIEDEYAWSRICLLYTSRCV